MESIPIFYQNKLQFVDQVKSKTFLWSNKAPSKSAYFDQQISLEADGDESFCFTPYPIKARNPVRTFTPDDVGNRFTYAGFTAQKLGIHNQHDGTKSMNKLKFNQLVDDPADKIELAQAVNFADLAKQAQLQAQFSQL